jgi:hypothetical protein
MADIEPISKQQHRVQMPQSKSLLHHRPAQPLTCERAVKSAATPGEVLPKSAWADRVIELDASQIRAASSENETDYSLMKPTNVNDSWMPKWLTEAKSKVEEHQGK